MFGVCFLMHNTVQKFEVWMIFKKSLMLNVFILITNPVKVWIHLMYSYDAKLILPLATPVDQCHMILQKSFKYADLLLKHLSLLFCVILCKQ